MPEDTELQSDSETRFSKEVKVVEVTLEDLFGETVQLLRNYGVGIDTHSKFIAICVYVKNGQNIKKYEREYNMGRLKASQTVHIGCNSNKERTRNYNKQFTLHDRKHRYLPSANN
jgi:hypothetical protein